MKNLMWCAAVSGLLDTHFFASCSSIFVSPHSLSIHLRMRVHLLAQRTWNNLQLLSPYMLTVWFPDSSYRNVTVQFERRDFPQTLPPLLHSARPCNCGHEIQVERESSLWLRRQLQVNSYTYLHFAWYRWLPA